MTLQEVYVALFWMVAGGYVIYLGWTIYRIATERAARRRHPSSRKGNQPAGRRSDSDSKSHLPTRTR